MPFTDRRDAGRQLAEQLQFLRGLDPIVLALPRGGVPVGYDVAKALDAPLDVVVARKLGAPDHPEFGVGAIAPDGVRVVDQGAVRALGISDAALEAVTERERVEMKRRLRRYRGDRPFPSLADRAVVLVDDGLATGVTARAALAFLQGRRPGRLVLAVPVCAPESADALQTAVDDLVCVEAPADFGAVGLWYDRFEQTSDDEVVALLHDAWERAPPTPAHAQGRGGP